MTDWKEKDVKEIAREYMVSDGSDPYGPMNPQSIQQQAQAIHSLKQMRKRNKNAHYGKGAIRSREEEHFRNVVDEIRNSPNGRVFNAHKVRGFRDLFLKSLQHIREKQFDTDGYKWFLHIETMEMVRHLFDDHFINSGQTTGINPDSYAIHGVEFVMVKGVPEGQIILADNHFIKRDPIRPHAMALIENATDGYPSEIPLKVGGEIELYTIQK